MKNSENNNNSGMTLVEILAALVILGIVFVGLMTVFPQMTIFNKKTGIKLETMNLARDELNSVKTQSIPSEFYIEKKKNEVNNNKRYWTNSYEIFYIKSKYQVEVDYYYSPDIKPENSKSEDGQIYLFKVHIKIFKEGKLSSETLGYIDAKQNEVK